MFTRLALGLLLLLGIAGIGLTAVTALRKPVEPTVAAAPPPPPVVLAPVLVAARSLRAGALLGPEDLGGQELPQDQVTPAMLPDTLANRAILRGAMVRRSLAAGDRILPADILSPGDRGFLAAVLAPGTRAVSVGVDAVSGTAGLIWPGDRVDLVLTQAIDAQDQPIDRKVAGETVLRDLRVIAVDQQMIQGGQGSTPSNPGGANRTVTLETSPADAERVAVASRLGRLAVTVRAATEPSEEPTRVAELHPVSMTDAVPTPPAALPEPPRPIVWSGDVSPALRARPNDKQAVTIKVYAGTRAAQEVKF